MKKSIFENKRVLWTSLGIFLFMVLFVLPVFIDVETKAAEGKVDYLSRINLQKIGASLLQYSQKQLKFPAQLNDLVGDYVSADFIKPPVDGVDYIYLKGVDSSIPFNIPLIVESEALGVTWRGEKFGRVLRGDFEVVNVGENLLKRYIYLINELQKIANMNDGKQILNKLNSEMQYRNDSVVMSFLLWKLGKLKYKPAISIVRKCQKYYNPANTNIESLAYSIAMQANYSLFLINGDFDKKFIVEFLKSSLYFHRRRAWSMLNSRQKTSINTAISPVHAGIYYNSMVSK